MAYLWVAQPLPGTDLSSEDLQAVGLGQRFEDQGQAEQWLGAFYAELADLGVESVSLMEEDRLVYGPMPLAED